MTSELGVSTPLAISKLLGRASCNNELKKKK